MKTLICVTSMGFLSLHGRRNSSARTSQTAKSEEKHMFSQAITISIVPLQQVTQLRDSLCLDRSYSHSYNKASF